jgi:hypothetical protein
VLWALAVTSNGCDDLKIAHSQGPGGEGSSSPAGDGGATDAIATTDGGTRADATSGPSVRPYYADVQAVLEAKRFAGPTTGMLPRSSHCTPTSFVWVDADKSVHSWRGTTKVRVDYGFTDTGFHSYLLPSDAFFTVERPVVFLDVYRMGVTNMLVSSIPYSENFVSAPDGVLLLDQKSGGVDLGGTKVRRWNAATTMTEDITGVLATREAPSSFANDTLVIPGAMNAPYPIHLVDVVKKTSRAVTYSNGNMLLQTEPSADGLLVAYVQGSAGAALRLYQGNLDTAAARLELGDDIDVLPPYFEDPPSTGQEHDFRGVIATWGRKVLFTTDYGIWSYDLASKALAPVQINEGKAPGTPNIMCVMRDAGLLVYQRSNLANEVWAVPLSATFP